MCGWPGACLDSSDPSLINALISSICVCWLVQLEGAEARLRKDIDQVSQVSLEGVDP